MWRNLTVMLFLMVLAQTANALPSTALSHDNISFHANVALTEHQGASAFDTDESEDLFNLPRLNRYSPSLFSAEIQTSPNYLLVIEFFKITLNAGLFKNLINPPVIPQWFEKLSHSANSSRLSGWKDGNFIYSSRTTYHR